MNVPDSPGVYENLTYEQYDAIKAARRSLLLTGRNSSLAHLRYEMDHPEGEPSEALLFGQALHAATLEPDRFEKNVILGPTHDINDKDTGEVRTVFYGTDTKAYRSFAAQNPGKIIMAKGDRERLIGMGAAIRQHPNAGALIRATTLAELTLVWDDDATGIRCKARLDSFIGGGMGMLDIKSTKNASPEAFPRALYEYGYHMQAAMSLDGWKALTGSNEPFTLIACEKEPPYAVACYMLGEDTIEIGRREYRAVLHAIANARRTGEWPGYPTNVMQIDVPEWVFKRFHSAA